MNDSYKPKILAFLCNWCSYAGADLAGVSRIQYPPFIRVVRVMCSGRVDPLFIVNALKEGFDGVLVSGCHIGDCHYLEGNKYTVKRMEILAQLLDLSGIGRKRVHLRWASAAEAKPFADNVIEVSNIIKEAGPFNAKDHEMALNALTRALSTTRLRWLVGIDRHLTENENVYHEKTDPILFEKVKNDAITAEYQKALIQEALSKGPVTVREMADQTGIAIYTVSKRLNELELGGMADLKSCEGNTPRFASPV
ncbi:MAG: hydrogenase iron-sulfur subunit [Proteobacteria bacterium]|nr:hydrogenase iron-sulfur subunit [Pseudomonadota bacterium]MBU4010146.1 hydrogenase iron-sulfur subunit [Pseudomonadota bacterium]MBU4036548.1 hydrogenase iron-sulfur subunit [Pseudomonadota bacterium]